MNYLRPTLLIYTGIREPLIIVKPNTEDNNIYSSSSKVQARRNDSLVSLLDLMPTILDWDDKPIPKDLTGKSLKKQMEQSTNAKFALIIAPKEFANGTVIIRNMSNRTEKETKVENLLSDPQSVLNL